MTFFSLAQKSDFRPPRKRRDAPGRRKTPHKTFQMPPRRPQTHPKMTSSSLQDGPRTPQDTPKRPQDAPKRVQGAPESLQGAPKMLFASTFTRFWHDSGNNSD